MKASARLNFFLAASALFVLASLASAADEPVIAKEIKPDENVFIPKPILKTSDVDKKAFFYLQEQEAKAKAAAALDEKKKPDLIDLKPASIVNKPEKVVDPLPPFEPVKEVDPLPPFEPVKIVDPLPPVEPAEQPIEEQGSSIIKLPPILPMLGGMSPFLKSIFAAPVGMDSTENGVDETNINEHDFMPKRPHGVMTIVLIKSSKKNPDDSSEQVDSNMIDRVRPNINFIMSKIIPKYFSHMFGGDQDIADRKHDMADMDDMMINRHHPMLGGGDHDIDRMRYEQPQLIGAEENFINNRPSFIIRTDGDDQPTIISEEIGTDSRRPQPKKCMMMSFMRLKASAYYRTIVHLLFFSGIALLFLFMIILTLRVYKRRQALRYYNHNLHVATVSNDDLPPKKNGSSNTFLFRIGSLRNSYAQKQADCDAHATGKNLFHAPPAYEKVISNSTKLTRQNSALARAYQKEADDDSKSTTSLPAYNDALNKKTNI